MTCKNLREAISVIGNLGYNLFDGPRFTEWYIARAIDAEQLEWNAAADMMTMGGRMVEVKTSRPVNHYLQDGTVIHRYKWQGLQGHTKNHNKDGNIDYYILVGVQEWFNEYWIVPGDKMDKRSAHAHPQQTKANPSWLDEYYYGTDIENVRTYFRMMEV